MATSNSLTLIDNRTATSYSLPIENGTIRAMDLRKIKTGPEDFGLMTYDPAFMNTASCQQRITFIDGDRGILRYRGYPIEVLAEHCTYLEVAYLLSVWRTAHSRDLKNWVNEITHHTMLHENHEEVHGRLPLQRPPHGHAGEHGGSLVARSIPRSRNVHDPANRLQQIQALIGKMPSIAAMSYRHSLGFPYVYPDNDLSYPENFMNMLWKMVEPKYVANPGHCPRAWTFSSSCMPTTSRTAAPTPCAPWAVPTPIRISRRRLRQRPWPDLCTAEPMKPFSTCSTRSAPRTNVPAYIKKIKEGQGKLMGFGHRVYKNYDPRAKIIKWTAENVFEVTGGNPKLDIALELERIALEDEYFVTRKLYPNVDFYSGIIYQAMGFKPEMFTVLFAIPRMAGWLAQWQEMITDPSRRSPVRGRSTPDTNYGSLCPLKSGCRLLHMSLHPTTLAADGDFASGCAIHFCSSFISLDTRHAAARRIRDRMKLHRGITYMALCRPTARNGSVMELAPAVVMAWRAK